MLKQCVANDAIWRCPSLLWMRLCWNKVLPIPRRLLLQSDKSRSPLSLKSYTEPWGPLLDGIPLMTPLSLTLKSPITRMMSSMMASHLCRSVIDHIIRLLRYQRPPLLERRPAPHHSDLCGILRDGAFIRRRPAHQCLRCSLA